MEVHFSSQWLKANIRLKWSYYRFEGISWNHEENLIAYVAEEPTQARPVFDDLGYKEGSADKDCGSWKAQGDWEEDWGETYSKKRKPSLFVVNISRSIFTNDIAYWIT